MSDRKGMPVQPSEMIPVSTGADIANGSSLGHNVSGFIYDAAARRQDMTGERHAIVILDGWGVDPTYGPIADSRAILTESIKDYSSKSYRLTDAFEMDLEALQQDPDQPFTNVIEKVNEEDFSPGVKYLPKKVVECIGAIQT